jgi:hypothetical protein
LEDCLVFGNFVITLIPYATQIKTYFADYEKQVGPL